MNRRPKRRTWTTSFTPMIFCGVKTMSEELKPCPFCGGSNLRSSGDDKWVGYECLDCGCIGPNQYDSRRDWNTRTALSQAAVGATVRACAEAILHDHTKPDDNRLWGDERPYICEESAYRTILALEPDAQPMCAAVKPLTFSKRAERLPDGAHLAADCAFGRYYIVNRGEYGFGWKRAGAYVFQGFEPTEAGAIAAAQVDYTRRITEALDIRTVESVLQGVCYILTSSHEDPKLDYGCDTLRDDEDTYISVEWVKRVFERYTREAK